MRAEFMVIPGADGPVLRIDAATHARREAGRVVEGSILGCTATGVPLKLPATGAMPVFCWSGSYAERDGGSLFDEDPRTWGPKGWAALESGVQMMGERRREVVIRTHARHVLSDAPSVRCFVHASWASGVKVFIDPASMLTPGMLAGGFGADHLRRLYEGLSSIDPACAAGVLISGADMKDGIVRPCPIERGALPADVVIGLASGLPDGLPLAVWHERWGDDVAALLAG